MSKMLAKQMKQMVIEKTQSFLVNENERKELCEEMFESNEYVPAERTLIPSIPPASIRIKNF